MAEHAGHLHLASCVKQRDELRAEVRRLQKERAAALKERDSMTAQRDFALAVAAAAAERRDGDEASTAGETDELAALATKLQARNATLSASLDAARQQLAVLAAERNVALRHVDALAKLVRDRQRVCAADAVGHRFLSSPFAHRRRFSSRTD
jgi:chromosome segregation ATPase